MDGPPAAPLVGNDAVVVSEPVLVTDDSFPPWLGRGVGGVIVDGPPVGPLVLVMRTEAEGPVSLSGLVGFEVALLGIRNEGVGVGDVRLPVADTLLSVKGVRPVVAFVGTVVDPESVPGSYVDDVGTLGIPLPPVVGVDEFPVGREGPSEVSPLVAAVSGETPVVVEFVTSPDETAADAGIDDSSGLGTPLIELGPGVLAVTGPFSADVTIVPLGKMVCDRGVPEGVVVARGVGRTYVAWG